MGDIKKIKSNEMQEIIDFYYFIEDYGHIFYGKEKELDESFKKIISGIEEIRKIVNYYYDD